jgi:sensor c-di-GMP phosphodiesterase-like protein
VAEGVETAEQQQFFSDQGCDMLQGYWYSKPLDAISFEAFALQAEKRERQYDEALYLKLVNSSISGNPDEPV